ncbi:MAG: magnesium transporter CorA family protein [Candidatus Pacebacteria bacterium]|nr:magnesium transporter CorA family protein [Candidatus Paceibacterota bacterium]
MISRYAHQDLLWIDVQSPIPEEIRSLMEEFKIHPLVAEELLVPTVRSKVDWYPNLIYLVLHFPTITHKHDGGSEQEIDFVIGKKFLITAHYNFNDTVHEFSKIFEVSSILQKDSMGDHAGFILFYLLKELYKKLDLELEHIHTDFKEIELKIFSGNERSMVTTISHLNRDLLNFKQAIRPHRETLESFKDVGAKLFGQEFSHYLSTIVGEYSKVSSMLDGHRETLLELRGTNDSLLTTKTNEVMKTFTIMAFVMLPATLVASVFSTSVDEIPFAHDPNGFWIIWAIVLLVSCTTYLLIKNSKWM